MLYQIKQGRAKINPPLPLTAEGIYLGFFPLEELEHWSEPLQIHSQYKEAFENESGSKIELGEGHDVLFLRRLPAQKEEKETRFLLYLSPTRLFVFFQGEPDLPAHVEQDLLQGNHLTAGKQACHFLRDLLQGDEGWLERMEEEITQLEDRLLQGEEKNCTRRISAIRRELMGRKSYYEQLQDVLDGLQENENESLDDSALRTLKILDNRISRLYQNVLNLREYATQVREAYQSQVDIDLNKTMKIFTVVTTVFLPLSLIAAWYGMNLKMPEFSWRYGYPMVIVLSVFVVGVCVLFFKKRKWF